MQILKSYQQYSDMLDRDYTEVSVGDIGATIEEACADGAHHIADLFGAMLDAGVAADGMSKKELGSVMKMTILSDGELTQYAKAKGMRMRLMLTLWRRRKEGSPSRTLRNPKVT
jgi:hypothetical protein